MEITKTEIATKKLSRRLRIALAADIHNSPPHRIIAALEQFEPDIICIPGDLMSDLRYRKCTEANANAVELLRRAASVAPVFYSPGNHELSVSPENRRLIEDTGAVLLDNSWVDWGEIRICGLSSGMTVNRPGKTPPPAANVLREFEAGERFKLLLCHHPEYYPQFVRGRKIDLTLSGHAHGGQWRFFGRGVYAPGQGLFPKYTSGLYDGGRLYVSRGLSNTAFPVPRLFNKTELAVIDLVSTGQKTK